MKQANLSLYTAKELYKQGGASKSFALDNYSEKELTEKQFPKTWEELEVIKGYCITTYSSVFEVPNPEKADSDKNTFPTKEQAEASLALSQLLQLKYAYNEGKPIAWNGIYKYFTLAIEEGDWRRYSNIQGSKTFAFHTEKARDLFLENFRDNLLEKVKPLFM